MKKLILLLGILFISFSSNAQIFGNWFYSSDNDPFSGSYQVISTSGSGGQFPYRNPKMVINRFDNDNNKINIYFKDAGGTHCGSLKVYIVFDNDNKVYEHRANTNVNKDTWFISFEQPLNRPNVNTLTRKELFNKMKSRSTMHVKVTSSCSSMRFRISLTGFTRAYNRMFN